MPHRIYVKLICSHERLDRIVQHLIIPHRIYVRLICSHDSSVETVMVLTHSLRVHFANTSHPSMFTPCSVIKVYLKPSQPSLSEQ